jgi:hypothetical protein
VEKTVDIGELVLTEDTVLKALLRINASKGDGPDNVSPLFVSKCAHSLLQPLRSIFNLSLSSRNFPSRWKISYVKPIFKSGARNDVENYRGVAILPTFGKLFESIVCDYLTLRFRGKISIKQHGFLKGRSTSTNLVEFANHAISVVESRSQLDAIYTDIRKAFDRVRHNVLLKKLNGMGLHSDMLGWLESYLRDRRQYVKVLGWKSRSFSVGSGVPQGSHLGPLLFLLFIDDVTKVFKYSKCSLYADDLKLFKKIQTVLDSSSLQRDLDALYEWCKFNCLDLNIGKCSVISFYRIRQPIIFGYAIDGTSLERVKRIRDLGVYFDENLSFNYHVDYIVSKAYAMLGFMKRICYEFRDVRSLKSIYFAHVRSHLEYAAVVWYPYCSTYRARIESVQKQFLIYALRRSVWRDSEYRLPSYLSRCGSIGVETLARRRINQGVFFVYDLLRGHIDSPQLKDLFIVNAPGRIVRYRDFLKVMRHRTNYGYYEPVSNMSMEFNRFAYLLDHSDSRDGFRVKVRSSSSPQSALIESQL